MDLLRIAARVAAGEKTLVFSMPGDQDWDPDYWNRIGEDPGWEQVQSAFEAAGAEVDDTEDVTLTFPAKREKAVRAVVEAARAGKFGKDVQIYWTAAKEVAG